MIVTICFESKTYRKWAIYRILLIFSAIMTRPSFCGISNLLIVFQFNRSYDRSMNSTHLSDTSHHNYLIQMSISFFLIQKFRQVNLICRCKGLMLVLQALIQFLFHNKSNLSFVAIQINKMVPRQCTKKDTYWLCIYLFFSFMLAFMI